MTADTAKSVGADWGADFYRRVLDHAPAALWATAPGGACSYVNSAWLRLTGQTSEETRSGGWLGLVHPDDRAEAETGYAAANAAQTPFRLEFRLRTAGGTYRRTVAAGDPQHGEGGEFLGYVGSLVDVHDRCEAEERLSALTGTVPAFVWFAGRNGELHYLNDRWYEYSGQTPEQALPNGWIDVVHPADVEAVLTAWAETRARGMGYAIECRFRRSDGVYRWYMVRADPVTAAVSQALAWVGTSIDIHDLKAAEERQALLINELNHRVKNTLATVQALAAQILQTSPEPAAFRAGFEDRLIGLAHAHDLLTAGNWAGARLRDVVARALAPWRDASRPKRIDVAGPAVWLDPQQALSISMALYELATNAAKYGALSTPAGQVVVRWSCAASETGQAVQLHWRERGGPPVAPPKRRGFGSRLLERGLGRELQGSVALAFPPEGASCRIDFPLQPEASSSTDELSATESEGDSGLGGLVPESPRR